MKGLSAEGLYHNSPVNSDIQRFATVFSLISNDEARCAVIIFGSGNMIDHAIVFVTC